MSLHPRISIKPQVPLSFLVVGFLEPNNGPRLIPFTLLILFFFCILYMFYCHREKILLISLEYLKISMLQCQYLSFGKCNRKPSSTTYRVIFTLVVS